MDLLLQIAGVILLIASLVLSIGAIRAQSSAGLAIALLVLGATLIRLGRRLRK